MHNNQKISSVADQAGATYLVVTDLVTIKLTGEETNSAYALLEVRVPPGGGPPGMHKHPAQETFCILEGKFQFSGLVDGALYTLTAQAGTVVHIPAAAPRQYKNLGATAGRMSVILCPAGNEKFFAEVGLPVINRNNLPRPASPPNMERIRALTAKYQIEPVQPVE
jgi:quercetin dioxygenase-like cupin family protein